MAYERKKHEKKPEPRRHSGHATLHSDGETRAKATMKEIEELYSALQGLVPKNSAQTRKSRGTRSGTDSDTPKSPRLERRYHSEKNLARNTDKNTEEITSLEFKEQEELPRVMSEGCLLDIGESSVDATNNTRERFMSLPTYPDESADEAEEATPKKSRFLIFRRRRRRSKPNPQKKRKSSWRAFFSSLNLRGSSVKKAKKKGSKNKTEKQDTATKKDPSPILGRVHVRTTTPKLTRSATSAAALTPLTQKRRAPDPPVDIPLTTEQRRHSLDNNIDEVDEVKKKISAWYKHAVRETNQDSPQLRRLRHYKSHDSLLTDTELMRPRNAMTVSSDTDGVTPQNLENLRRIRVRKTRAKRNRQKERARWRSLPNVKLVSHVVNRVQENPGKPVEDEIDVKEPEELPSPTYATSVTPVQANIPFGNSFEEITKSVEPITDFMHMRQDSVSHLLNRQRPRTTESSIRPLKLNFLYSESPSRETAHRSQSFYASSRLWFTGKPDTENQVSLKIHRNSGQRRRKRRSFRRQLRLSQQSPFYFPNGENDPSKFSFAETKKDCVEDAKDSGLGSPDHLEEKAFGLTSAGKRKHSEDECPKLNWESEDSGWASRDFTRKVEFEIQTDPTRQTIALKPQLQQRAIDVGENEGQSEA